VRIKADMRDNRSPELTGDLLSMHGGPRGSEHDMEGHTQTSGPDLLIVDDCRLYRDSLATIMTREYGAAAVFTAHDVTSMLKAIADRSPDVILLNLASFDSRAMMQAARMRAPKSRLIVLGVSEDDEGEIVACAEAGVSGYHLRTGSLEDLIQLIGSVVAGESLCSPRVSALLLRRLAALAAEGRSDDRVLALTQREIQIVDLLDLGLSNKEIAERLCIEVTTVKNHVHSLLSKLGVRRRAHAAAVLRRRTYVGEPTG
jgi:DNA-binding NarL/FixJ family response regulator